MGSRSDIVARYNVRIGSAEFTFLESEYQDMMIFVAAACKHIDKGQTPMDESVTVKKEYFYADELEDDFNHDDRTEIS